MKITLIYDSNNKQSCDYLFAHGDKVDEIIDWGREPRADYNVGRLPSLSFSSGQHIDGVADWVDPPRFPGSVWDGSEWIDPPQWKTVNNELLRLPEYGMLLAYSEQGSPRAQTWLTVMSGVFGATQEEEALQAGLTGPIPDWVKSPYSGLIGTLAFHDLYTVSLFERFRDLFQENGFRDIVLPPVVDINTATVDRLKTLPTVGDAISGDLVSGRPYSSIDQATLSLPHVNWEELSGYVYSTINLNSAPVGHLKELPQVGSATAAMIEENRPYVNIFDAKSKMPSLSWVKFEHLVAF